MNSTLQNKLAAAPDKDSLCRTLRRLLRPYGAVANIDFLTENSLCGAGIVCLVDMGTVEQQQAARRALGLPALGRKSLVVSVERPSFDLVLPTRWNQTGHRFINPAARAMSLT
jgi:hypothetical protein